MVFGPREYYPTKRHLDRFSIFAEFTSVFADKQTTEWATLVETSHIYAMKSFLLTFIPTQRLILEAITTSSLIIPFIMT